MVKELFDIGDVVVGSNGWAKKYCLNRISEIEDIVSVVGDLLEKGGIGGDLDWGVHRWDEYSEEDYGVGKFEGFRYYVGEAEHGQVGRGDIEDFSGVQELKAHLLEILRYRLGEDVERSAKDVISRFDLAAG